MLVSAWKTDKFFGVACVGQKQTGKMTSKMGKRYCDLESM